MSHARVFWPHIYLLPHVYLPLTRIWPSRALALFTCIFPVHVYMPPSRALSPCPYYYNYYYVALSHVSPPLTCIWPLTCFWPSRVLPLSHVFAPLHMYLSPRSFASRRVLPPFACVCPPSRMCPSRVFGPHVFLPRACICPFTCICPASRVLAPLTCLAP